MARPKKAETTVEITTPAAKPVEQAEKPESNEMSVAEMKKLIATLTAQVEKLSAEKEKEPTTVEKYVGSRMDTPCTIIHLIDCAPNLPTTITVNGREVPFNRFGEKRTFRFADLQDIVAHYRSWFERGVFVLGEDCIPFENELGIKVKEMPINIAVYNKLAELPPEEFKSVVNRMPEKYAVSLAKVWIDRHNAHVPGYDNFEYARILSKKTGGFMRTFMSDLVDSNN